MSISSGATMRPFFLRFVTVGVGAAVLFFALGYILAAAGMRPFFASSVAYLCAFAVAYTGQRNWTFGGEQQHRVALPRYLIAQLGCAFFSGVISHIAVHAFGASPLVMSATTTVIASAASYVLSSRWVFVTRD